MQARCLRGRQDSPNNAPVWTRVNARTGRLTSNRDCLPQLASRGGFRRWTSSPFGTTARAIGSGGGCAGTTGAPLGVALAFVDGVGVVHQTLPRHFAHVAGPGDASECGAAASRQAPPSTLALAVGIGDVRTVFRYRSRHRRQRALGGHAGRTGGQCSHLRAARAPRRTNCTRRSSCALSPSSIRPPRTRWTRGVIAKGEVADCIVERVFGAKVGWWRGHRPEPRGSSAGRRSRSMGLRWVVWTASSAVAATPVFHRFAMDESQNDGSEHTQPRHSQGG